MTDRSRSGTSFDACEVALGVGEAASRIVSTASSVQRSPSITGTTDVSKIESIDTDDETSVHAQEIELVQSGATAYCTLPTPPHQVNIVVDDALSTSGARKYDRSDSSSSLAREISTGDSYPCTVRPTTPSSSEGSASPLVHLTTTKPIDKIPGNAFPIRATSPVSIESETTFSRASSAVPTAVSIDAPICPTYIRKEQAELHQSIDPLNSLPKDRIEAIATTSVASYLQESVPFEAPFEDVPPSPSMDQSPLPIAPENHSCNSYSYDSNHPETKAYEQTTIHMIDHRASVGDEDDNDDLEKDDIYHNDEELSPVIKDQLSVTSHSSFERMTLDEEPKSMRHNSMVSQFSEEEPGVVPSCVSIFDEPGSRVQSMDAVNYPPIHGSLESSMMSTHDISPVCKPVRAVQMRSPSICSEIEHIHEPYPSSSFPLRQGLMGVEFDTIEDSTKIVKCNENDSLLSTLVNAPSIQSKQIQQYSNSTDMLSDDPLTVPLIPKPPCVAPILSNSSPLANRVLVNSIDSRSSAVPENYSYSYSYSSYKPERSNQNIIDETEHTYDQTISPRQTEQKTSHSKYSSRTSSCNKRARIINDERKRFTPPSQSSVSVEIHQYNHPRIEHSASSSNGTRSSHMKSSRRPEPHSFSDEHEMVKHCNATYDEQPDSRSSTSSSSTSREIIHHKSVSQRHHTAEELFPSSISTERDNINHHLVVNDATSDTTSDVSFRKSRSSFRSRISKRSSSTSKSSSNSSAVFSTARTTNRAYMTDTLEPPQHFDRKSRSRSMSKSSHRSRSRSKSVPSDVEIHRLDTESDITVNPEKYVFATTRSEEEKFGTRHGVHVDDVDASDDKDSVASGYTRVKNFCPYFGGICNEDHTLPCKKTKRESAKIKSKSKSHGKTNVSSHETDLDVLTTIYGVYALQTIRPNLPEFSVADNTLNAASMDARTRSPTSFSTTVPSEASPLNRIIATAADQPSVLQQSSAFDYTNQMPGYFPYGHPLNASTMYI